MRTEHARRPHPIIAGIALRQRRPRPPDRFAHVQVALTAYVASDAVAKERAWAG